LVELGLVVEGETLVSGERGRPAELLYVRHDAARLIGVNLTSTSASAVLIDLAAHILEQRTRPLPSRRVEDVVAVVAEMREELSTPGREPSAIGVSLAGDVTSRAGAAWVDDSAFLGWDSVPLADLVRDATGLPVTLINDVRGLAEAHHWFDKSPSREPALVYGVGAGIGSGFMIGDAPVQGASGRAGRIPHLPVGEGGRPCVRGHTTCVHSFVTIPAIEYVAGARSGDYRMVLERAGEGDQSALNAFRMAARALGMTVSQAISTLDPGVVSVMGEGLHMLDFAPEEFEAGLGEYLDDDRYSSIPIERPQFSFALYARGAAIAAMREMLSPSW